MTLHKDRTYTPKEALHADPNWTKEVKLGRGRMPAGGDEHCQNLAAQGYRIKGYAVKAATSPTSTARPVVEKVAPAANVIQDFVIFWDMREFKAVGVDKKEWGMAEVCNTCRVSLVQCHCGSPTILEDIPVRIVKR